MRTVFADTFYWIALCDPADPRYVDSLRVERQISEVTIVTTEEVLSEFLTFFAGDPWSRERASRAVHALLRDSRIRVTPQSHESFVSGWDLYSRRPDKEYSLTDCISMQTMHREGLTEVLTNDRHFEQEGFRALFHSSGR